ncbi:G-type lectin S-receptor-like serine/threonine-protein kinase SD3-1 isoform X2 [Hevea brasiliensis]|uniref:G-type lectin S-receptor-like serine/threonine-protein kinase SD3-1 isoform X2 n=1 Tax=Hevea brasiliensis TaxID=3981 RepID=UPI0025E6FE89|nr:G-type lectin S-receptor-like serine/threonine-protein kinase SD3-1 isoform X2 [Hevea brasiliensis]XP_057999801.1 G-type lectin S-receptor-like serine/threonine-protein kinase SD3-1 isoform X2 [Hevea brasiliensis]XP_057999802.1 G-type lectin S-receptor-like serine/threonine-protein kinase SD3-1 isoform X2 [Hevea brasiliensis]XP_057999803.1 G-type lectin S-receptor-like serine/threonine-protein kinase SD3-1 isoform X2 [Hevea brasiliensis]
MCWLWSRRGTLCRFLEFLASSLALSGSKLSVEENSSWVSPIGDFAIGFFNHSDQPNQYGVGIRFNSKSIPVGKQTVVWVAGAEITVGNKSYFQLSQSGELVLVDSLKGVMWTSKTSRSAVVSALLRDDGNLVLLDEMGSVVWQSFDNPSDTILPGQSLSIYKTLRAASKNSVSSYYSLYMNASGQLQLRWESDVMYWTSGNPSMSNLSAVLTSDGILQLVDQTLKPMWSVFGDDHNDAVNFRLLRLDVDGNLRMYSWEAVSKSWRSVWQAVENQCNVFATCGEHGVCVFNSSGSPECRCPFKITSDPNSKCFAQDCKSASSMVTYEHTSLYEIYPPTDSIILTSLQQCEAFCLRNSFCTAATFTNDGTAKCLVKTTPYFSGYSGPSLSSVSFIKTCSDPLPVDPHASRSSSAQSPAKHSHRLCIPCLVGAASGTFVLFAVIHLAIGCYIYRRRNMIWKKAALACMTSNSKGLMMLSFTEIKEITGNFKHQIGPKTYRGVLPNHQPVAIKELETTIEERKFRAAVSKIGSIHHRNLVKLNGYCCELGKKILVYEYVKNGSVHNYMEDDELSKRLTWRRRLNICLGVARAICYLHTGCREFVSHGTLKCENVVLDKNYEAKVSEFGLGIVHPEASCVREKDVEDVGKMLLILVTGCLQVGEVCELAYKEWIQGRPERVVDNRIDGGVDREELERMLRTAFWCLQSDERMRPSMGEVVKVLEGTLTVDPPPPPCASQSLPAKEALLESSSEP